MAQGCSPRGAQHSWFHLSPALGASREAIWTVVGSQELLRAHHSCQGRTLLADDLFAAYFGPGSPSRRFRAALGEVSRANAAQDFLAASKNDPDLHFDAERLGQARERLVGALREALVAARAQDHTLARQRLGAALHALQVGTWGGVLAGGASLARLLPLQRDGAPPAGSTSKLAAFPHQQRGGHGGGWGEGEGR